jgi:hypothetical protein
VLAAAVVALLVSRVVSNDSQPWNGVVGSGVAATETRHLPAFDGIELDGANDVVVHVGGAQSVVVRGDDNLVGRVTTRVSGDRLVIGTTGTFRTASPMRVDVRVPELTAASLSGAGNVTLRGVEAPRLDVRLSGSGALRASGAVTRLDVELAGSGDVQLGRLVARDVSAGISGTGRIVVHARRRLDASVRGVGTIVYSGDPAHVKTSVSGVGAVEHVERLQ